MMSLGGSIDADDATGPAEWKSRKFFEEIRRPSEDELGSNGQKDTRTQTSDDEDEKKSRLADFISDDIVGSNSTAFYGPFGKRKVLYCDYTASGKPLKSIEDYIQREVLPLYANTHSSVTVTSEQSTLFTYEARDIIRNGVKAGEQEAVLFCGSGTTAAVHLLIHGLQLRAPPLVFLGPFEHHSNLLPWTEIAAQKRSDSRGERVWIGCFSAASNVTGVLADVDAVTEILHGFGALAFWDYATAAPYVPISMGKESTRKDAIYFSGHKFIGGPETPGVLVVKKSLLKNAVPLAPGGGSIFYVRRENRGYLKEAEFREEAGTPNIIGIVRLGLAFHLKNSVTSRYIMLREESIVKYVHLKLANVRNLILLGPTDVPKLTIFSFVIEHAKTGLLLHHNFVSALLDNVFGVESRAGCMCAGPYAHDLLGIPEPLAQKYEDILQEDSQLDRDHLRRKKEYSDYEMLRPGFVRLSIPFFMKRADIDFVLSAVQWIAEYGWLLLPQYKLNPETGEWHHRDHATFKYRKWLSFVSFDGDGIHYRLPSTPKNVQSSPETHKECLEAADLLAQTAIDDARRLKLPDDRILFNEHAGDLRWFLLASEAKRLLESDVSDCPKRPFVPKIYSTPLAVETNKNLGAFTMSHGSSTQSENDSDSAAAEPNCSAGRNRSFMQESSTKPALNEYHDQLKIESTSYAETALFRQISETANKAVKELVPESVSNGDRDETFENPSVRNNCPMVPTKQNWNERKIIVAQKDPAPEKLKYKWHAPPPSLFKETIKAVEEFEMIQKGDRILVCLSGGKDSLSLLHVMRQYQFYARSQGVEFELGAITIDPGSPSYDPSSLIGYLEGLNMTYLYEEQRILDMAMALGDLESICSFCSRMKRGRLYAAAKKFNFNVLAFGQHLDDLAESFMMSILHNGSLRTMKAHYTTSCESANIRVIRPFVFVRERELRQFAENKNLPVIPENCPACFDSPKERYRVKQLLAAQELLFPHLFRSLESALHPLLAVSATNNVEAKGEAVANIRRAWPQLCSNESYVDE